MRKQLQYQLEALRKQIAERPNSGSNVHWQIGETLNAIRGFLLSELEPHEDLAFQSIISPIHVDKPVGNEGPYSISSQDALRLCEQLMSLCVVDERADRAVYPGGIANDVKRLVPDGKRIFVIHGHDETNKLTLCKLLNQRFDLEPIVLAERASMGRALIEKFEEEASDVSFAFAIVTPDDLISTGVQSYSQARPTSYLSWDGFMGASAGAASAYCFKKEASYTLT
jgi:hypothetical protein